MTVPKKQNQFAGSVITDDLGALRDPISERGADVNSAAGRLAVYSSAASSGKRPLLLIHSVNAAASAFEVKPLFEKYRGQRPVYALDLPGLGQSDRSNRAYTVRLMTDAVIGALVEIRRVHNVAADAIALSLSCEFLARPRWRNPNLFERLA